MRRPPRWGSVPCGASAASTTSRGVFVRSAAQSRKLDRNPFATVAIRWYRSIFGKRRHGYLRPAPHGEHERIAAAERPRRLENLHRPPAQRHRVLALRLHPRCRDRPHQVVKVDFVPCRQPLPVHHPRHPRGALPSMNLRRPYRREVASGYGGHSQRPAQVPFAVAWPVSVRLALNPQMNLGLRCLPPDSINGGGGC